MNYKAIIMSLFLVFAFLTEVHYAKQSCLERADWADFKAQYNLHFDDPAVELRAYII